MQEKTGIFWARLQPRSLQAKMVLLVTGLLTVLVALIGYVFSGMIARTLEEDIGEKAMAISRSVASMQEIRDLVAAGDPDGRIQDLAEDIRKKTAASFVVVADRNRRRFSHPNPALIGQISESTDSPPVLLEGKSLISTRLGAIGLSIRGKTPVVSNDETIIGYVSVGFMHSEVKRITQEARRKIVPWVIVVVLIGGAGAIFLARGFKKAIFGLEPDEIGALFTERTAILQSIREGVIALDSTGRVSLFNQAALNNLGMPAEASVAGREIREVFAEAPMQEAFAAETPLFDRELDVAGQEMIFNIVPIAGQGKPGGLVASFRRKDEIDRMARELSRVQEYSEMLRSQTHEYSNKLNLIAGFIQLGATREALELITRESSDYQALLNFLNEAVPDPVLSAIILGKYCRANELKIRFLVDPQSHMADLPDWLNREKVVTILGNLLDNAFEAVHPLAEARREVRLSMTDLGHDLVFEVEDAGKGIDPETAQQIFERGFSTKGQLGRGVGLSLVKSTLADLGGEILLGSSELGGALFTVILPKRNRS